MSDSLIRDEFDLAGYQLDCKNIGRWGPTSLEALAVVLMEEIGEVARAILEKDSENLRDECIDAAAVLRRMYEQSNDLA